MNDASTPEAVALKLFEAIRKAERKTFTPESPGNHSPVDRKWILNTYKECLLTVKLRESKGSSLDYLVFDSVNEPIRYPDTA